jgi:hypothetical protein
VLLQNNNAIFAWGHSSGLICHTPELGCVIDTSLSDQSGLNLSFEVEDKFRGHPVAGPPKKGRGGRKKSAR